MLVLAVAMSLSMKPDVSLDELCQKVAGSTVEAYASKGLDAQDFGFAVGVLNLKENSLRFGGYRETEGFFPASVVKLFYLNYLANEADAGRIQLTAEAERAAKDMIVDSSNDATAYIVDLVTGTTGGPELVGSAWEEWQSRRQIVNRWYAARDYRGINVCQKTWGDGPYGREKASYGATNTNRNRLTPLATLRLMSEIATAQSIEVRDGLRRNWRAWMLGFLQRDPTSKADSQANEFIGGALPAGSKLHSKAGWTSFSRSDVAWVTLPDGREIVISIFTSGTDIANEPGIIQTIAKQLVEGAK